MSIYIEAEWLLNFFEPYEDSYCTPLGTLRACIDDAPHARIVRCKECRYWQRDGGDIRAFPCGIHKDPTVPDHYCGYGELKGE